ncbi:DUF3558 domain-containing protein [Kibdelosporangium aridum]|uniref:DUF3558 domain-containing protein n=1 Tax=Kibdelosporangium aridum TaxID=2030 RepID=A0A1Y5XIW8_KIBAR|nr:DUF3558 domain-containing protein [Kibdelosporangium aridum]SMC94044.1 Protein of unknown function [Kibdelosporangium aridum]
MASANRTSRPASAGLSLIRFALLAAVVGLALAGCTETAPGQAVPPAQTPPAGTAPGGGAPPTVAIPPRPRDISLDGVDPCKLLSKAQLEQIKVSRQKNDVQSEETFKNSQVCAMGGADGQVFFDYEIWLITTEGIDLWLTGKRNVDAKLVSVDGFPAASYKLRGTTTFTCDTSVGVADKQQLMVKFRPTSRGVFTQDQMCQKSEEAATLAMQTLKTLK